MSKKKKKTPVDIDLTEPRQLGRPSTVTEKVISRLEAVLRLDVSDKVACEYAGISRDTFYRTLKSNPDFSDRIKAAKNFARIAASQVVMKAILQENDVASAKWWLEKKYPEDFSSRPELLQDNRQVNIYVNRDELAERITRLIQD